jgi:hypothetical protein
MIQARILIKHNPSKCNKELLDFLHRNLKTIKKRFNLKIIIIYDDLIPKLPKTIKRLPVLITSGSATTGNNAIRQKLIAVLGTTKVESTEQVKDMGISDLQDYWNSEMHNGTDNDSPGDDAMDNVKNKALEASIKHQESVSKQKKRVTAPLVTNNREENIQLEHIQSDKISDLVDNDPVMQKFWDNQETTPGFGGGDEMSVDY